MKLHVIMYSDGRAGHEKQSLGIIKALQNYVELDISRKEVAHFTFTQNMGLWIRYFLHLTSSQCPVQSADLVIGSGSRTHIPILTCKRESNCRAVICMSPSIVIRNKFDLCFVPVHDRLPKASNIVETIGPPGISATTGSHDPAKSLILVGGLDEKSHVWDNDTILSHIKELIERSDDLRWTLSSSPRTPEETETSLSLLDKQFENVTFHPFHSTGPGWVEKEYGLNGMVWVTGDSISMVYEALSAGCNVGIIPVQWHRKNSKFAISEQYLYAQKVIVSLENWLAGKRILGNPVPLNEADKCAREILKRWWPESLQ